jgi:hypothetical protein
MMKQGHENCEAFLRGVERADAERGRLLRLGRKVEALLASEEPPEGLRAAVDNRPGYIGSTDLFEASASVWAWFREQLLEPVHPPVTDFMQTLKDAIRRQGEAEEDANGR